MRSSRLTEVDLELPPPPNLEARTFTIGPDAYVIFAYPLPALMPPSGLSVVERAVACDLMAGLRPTQIAKKRRRSISTVRNQIRSIYAKTGVGSLVEFIARCERQE